MIKTRWKRSNKIEASSLKVVSTPIDTFPTQKKKSYLKDAIQERTFITATAASTSKRDIQDNLSDTSRDSDISDL